MAETTHQVWGVGSCRVTFLLASGNIKRQTTKECSLKVKEDLSTQVQTPLARGHPSLMLNLCFSKSRYSLNGCATQECSRALHPFLTEISRECRTQQNYEVSKGGCWQWGGGYRRIISHINALVASFTTQRNYIGMSAFSGCHAWNVPLILADMWNVAVGYYPESYRRKVAIIFCARNVERPARSPSLSLPPYPSLCSPGHSPRTLRQFQRRWTLFLPNLPPSLP